MYKEDNSSYHSLSSNHSGFGLYNSTTNAYSFHVTSNDFFGIGTSTPSRKLDVNGGINATGYYLKNSGSSDYPGSYLHRLRAEDGNFYVDGDVGGSTYAPALTVHRLGNVGIGTADMRGYKLAVNGKVRAQEIKVETANWPDYVFAKDYSLPTLQETEKHIKDKGHLPGIPSAAEVKANGIDLGEMNAKLLQKIEELTLHLIEINEIVKRQQNEINHLKVKCDER
ncbi:hypothetical protein [Pedobacter africanus]|nr:hypothetical protein [Pedobacter africanus]